MAHSTPCHPCCVLVSIGMNAHGTGFLNDIVEQLWPNICVYAGNMVKETVEPILTSSLPSPLSNLKFVKIDLGHVPIRFSNVDVHKTTTQGIKLDMDLNWDGVCDIELDGSMVPKVGIEKVRMKGRISVLLCPLINVVPLVGAAQVAFINPPSLELDFTDAANVLDSALLSGTIRRTMIGIIEGMAVLPNRFLVKMDNNNDYFKTYQPHQGVLRLTVGRATNISTPDKKKGGIKGGMSRLMAKVKLEDTPDCYVKVKVGAEGEWRTSVVDNNHNPEWNETHDFLVADFEQQIFCDVQDDDTTDDDDIGLGSTTVKEILLNGGSHELPLSHQGQPTGASLTVHAQFYHLVSDANALSAAASQGEGQGQGLICGLATVLIASALGLQGNRDELQPSVKVALGDKTFQTAVKTYTPGTDIFNPSFDQAFRIPLTADMLANPGTFRISLVNGAQEVGHAEVPFHYVVGAEGMCVADTFEVGGGATVRASIVVRGIQRAE
ncbi:uncharacterized protein B0T15DRAFT_151841 [Chaetomium strumarium]|uniref:C2 domain-containing protein n=1 Tax=Chaetomium strumarium TaxID=1170767 RepID=A0AAJ0M2L5_9PEZI|nr:hypothetical protein B0T15DRAFT_151841 [Chaetomium strumarium]